MTDTPTDTPTEADLDETAAESSEVEVTETEPIDGENAEAVLAEADTVIDAPIEVSNEPSEESPVPADRVPVGLETPDPVPADPIADPDSEVADADGESPDLPDADAADAETETETDDPSADAADEEPPAPKQVSPYDRPGRWFVLHTQSGYENKVRSNIIARTSSMNMEERIYEVVIPMEDVVEFKNGKKVVVQKKVFPGYLLCRMRLDDDSWFVVRNTPGVTGFVGAGNKPSPLPRRDVENFLQVKEDGDDTARKGRPRLEFDMGETVRVKEGPFADFQGEIVEINEDQLKVKVLVNIFGRETPVELEFAQVGKI